MGKLYGSAINLSQTIDFKLKAPIDNRVAVEFTSDLLLLKEYEGLITYVKETDTYWSFHNGSWLEGLTGSGSSNINNEDITNIVNNVKINNNNHDYVDLGLTSGRLWAKTYIGATDEYSEGKYFGWKEVTGYTRALLAVEDEALYPSYNIPETLDLPTLALNAAHVNWGGNWTLPTVEYFLELLAECTWEYITEKNCIKVTGPNSNSIWFPLTGGIIDALTAKNTELCTFGMRLHNVIGLNSQEVAFWTTGSLLPPSISDGVSSMSKTRTCIKPVLIPEKLYIPYSEKLVAGTGISIDNNVISATGTPSTPLNSVTHTVLSVAEYEALETKEEGTFYFLYEEEVAVTIPATATVPTTNLPYKPEDTTYYSVTGDRATTSGTYTYTLTLKSLNYKWSDGTRSPKTLTVTIVGNSSSDWVLGDSLPIILA